MANGTILTSSGKKIAINRFTKSSPDYTVASVFKVGISNSTPALGDTALDVTIPITDGTVNDDGSNTLTGSSGGDNSTDNTSVFKPGAGVTDDTAQNLIANNGSATKIWTLADLGVAGSDIDGTQPFGLWLYILDATALAKFKSSGTCLEVKFGSDSSNYYSKTFEASDLAVGWNWITSGTTNVEDLPETSTVSGDIDTFIIEITTNNATDTFSAGDVVYDLLRQWATSDLQSSLTSGYPTVDETTFENEYRGELSATEAVGFDLNGFGLFNTDGTVLMQNEATFTAESKSDTDIFKFVFKNRIV